jgi:hypothetical protein
MRDRDLKPAEIDTAIRRFQVELRPGPEWPPHLITVARAAELLYGPTVWSRLERHLVSAWDRLLDSLQWPVHKIEDIAQGELMVETDSLRDFFERAKAVRYIPVLRMEVLSYDLAGDMRIDLADMLRRVEQGWTSVRSIE